MGTKEEIKDLQAQDVQLLSEFHLKYAAIQTHNFAPSYVVAPKKNDLPLRKFYSHLSWER
jgi:hypothetical protein